MPQISPNIQALINHPKEYFTAAQIARIVGKDANTLRHMARNMPERLPFPCLVNPEESTVRFPKWPFLAAYGYSSERVECQHNDSLIG